MTSDRAHQRPNPPVSTNVSDNKPGFRYPPVKHPASRTSRPTLKNMSNTIVVQAMESSRYIIEQPDLDAPSLSVPPSPWHKSHVRGPSYESFSPNVPLSPIRKNALPIGPTAKPARVHPVTSLGVSRPTHAAHLPLSLDSVDFPLQLQARHPPINSDGYPKAQSLGPALRRSSSLTVSPSLNSTYSSSSTEHIDCLPPREKLMDIGFPPDAKECKAMTRRIAGDSCHKSGIHTASNRNRDEAKEYRFPVIPARTSTPPLSPPPSSGSSTATGLSKRSGRCFHLVPTKVDGEDKFMHAVAAQIWPRVDEAGKLNFASMADSTDLTGDSSPGMPLDMFQTLGHLEGIAAVVKGLPRPRSRACMDFQKEGNMHYSNLGGGDDSSTTLRPSAQEISTMPTWADKGKWRVTAPSNKNKGVIVEMPSITKTKVVAKCIAGPVVGQQENIGYLYNPRLYRTPEFLIGSSKSPIVFAASGYHSLPKHHTVECQNPSLTSLSGSSTDHSSTPSDGSSGSYSYASRRSAPGTRPPLSAPPSGSKAGSSSLKAFFQRSRGNTTVVACVSTIPLSHLPVESSVSRDRRTRLPWLKI